MFLLSESSQLPYIAIVFMNLFSTLFIYLFFNVSVPLKDRAILTHPYRVNSGPVHQTLERDPNWAWLSRGLFTRV